MMSIFFLNCFQISIQDFTMDEASATFPIKIKKKERPLNQQGIKPKDFPSIGFRSVMKKGGLCLFQDFFVVSIYYSIYIQN